MFDLSLERILGTHDRNSASRIHASVDDDVFDRGSDQIERLARMGVFEVDLKTDALKWSKGTYEIFGLSPGTPISVDETLRFYDAHTRREIEARLDAARRRGEPYDITVPFRHTNGDARWMRIIAQVSQASGMTRLVGAVQDITREHYREEGLRIRAERCCGAEPDPSLLDEVETGLIRGEFEAYYQPIVDLRTHAVRGWEALIRWQHPKRGFLLPGQFAPALVHPATSAAIDEYMLKTSLSQMRRWLDDGVPVTCAGVNVSDSQLKLDDFADHVFELLEDHQLTPDRLKLEVLETAFLGQQTDAVARTIDRLAQRGIVSALDDFGTGYASLTHLKQFRVERIKIDRSFVANLGFNTFDHAIVNCLTTLGRDLGIRITAEGIETAEQLRILRSMGCDCGQGYLFSPPLTAAGVSDFLKKWHAGRSLQVFGCAEKRASETAPYSKWAALDAAVLVSCFGRRAKSFVERLAQAEQNGALSDVFPEHHFGSMLLDIDAVLTSNTER